MAKKEILGETIKVKKASLEILSNLMDVLESNRKNELRDYRCLKDENGDYILDENGSRVWDFVELTEENTEPERWANLQIKLRSYDCIAELLETLV